MSAWWLSVFLKRWADPRGEALWGPKACTFPLDLSSCWWKPTLTQITSKLEPLKCVFELFSRFFAEGEIFFLKIFAHPSHICLRCTAPEGEPDKFTALSTSFEKTCKSSLQAIFFKSGSRGSAFGTPVSSGRATWAVCGCKKRSLPCFRDSKNKKGLCFCRYTLVLCKKVHFWGTS